MLDPVILLTLTSLPYWILGLRLMTVRPVFNYDAVLALMLGAIAWPLGLLAVIGSWIADGIYSASFNYHFHSPQDFIRSFQFGGNLRIGQFLTWDLFRAGLPFVACAATLGALLRRHPLRMGPGIVLIATLMLLDTVNGSSRLSSERRDSWRIDANLVGTVMGNIVVSTYRQQVEPPTKLAPLAQRDVSEQILRWAGDSAGGNILLVVVESMGTPLDKRVRDWLNNQLLTPAVQQRWQVQADDIPFHGTTTDGELRALCDLGGSYRLVTAADAPHCLPSRLKSMGYTSQALHGFSGHMFDRAVWWPQIGFDQVRFAEDLATRPQCGGVFRGVCDDALTAQAVSDLRGASHRFTYLLTLNTHLPLTPGPIPADLAALCESAKVPSGSCQLLAQHGRFLRSLADQVATLDRPPLVAVVGDHAPPFFAREDRAQFDARHVPRFVLTPHPPAGAHETAATTAAF